MNASRFSRRTFLSSGLLGLAGVAGLARIANGCMECLTEKLEGKFPIGKTRVAGNAIIPVSAENILPPKPNQAAQEGSMDPMKYLTTFDYGETTRRADGMPSGNTWSGGGQGANGPKGSSFPPGSTTDSCLGRHFGQPLAIAWSSILRIGGASRTPCIFMGFIPANMDGVFEVVPEGKSFTYDFIAEPFGIFPYHCHMMPLRKHIARGLYGTLIVDPQTPRPPATEMIMVMHGLDVDLDMENEFYAVNGVANYYAEHPIGLKVGEKVRVYLSNMTEFDLVNNFHLHANMFEYYPNGTSLEPAELTDTINLCQGQRGILEFSYKYPGMYMFHAHTSEFAELGWMGFFDVKG